MNDSARGNARYWTMFRELVDGNEVGGFAESYECVGACESSWMGKAGLATC